MRTRFLLPIAAGLFAVAGSANALLIDSFTDNQSVVATASSSNSDVLPGTFVGTNRNLAVTTPAGRINADINTVTPGSLDVSNTTTSNGTATVTWTGIASIDFTDSGASNGLFLGIPSPIDNPLTITFTVNGSSTYGQSFPNGAVGSNFFFPFASFTNPSVFGSVSSLQMVLSSSTTAWDASIQFLETRPRPPQETPIPGTLALLGLGLAGLGLRRRQAA